MTSIIEVMEMILLYVVEVCTTCLEFCGIIVLVSSAAMCFYRWLKRDRQDLRLHLAQAIALALEFKMGGEVLRTVVVRDWSELTILGAIILLRAALTFLIHWEISNEKKEKEIHESTKKSQRRKRTQAAAKEDPEDIEII